MLDRDRRNFCSKDVADAASAMISKEGFTPSRLDLRNGQPHQLLRRQMRIRIISELGNEDFLDEVLVDELFIEKP